MHRGDPPHVNGLLVIMSPDPLAKFVDERRYPLKGVPLLKHVLPIPGQSFCRTDHAITVDRVSIGEATDRDQLSVPCPSGTAAASLSAAIRRSSRD